MLQLHFYKLSTCSGFFFFRSSSSPSHVALHDAYFEDFPLYFYHQVTINSLKTRPTKASVTATGANLRRTTKNQANLQGG